MLTSRPRRPLRPLVVASIVFLLAAVAAASLIWRIEQYRLQEWRTSAAAAASDHAQAIERNIGLALSVTYALAALVHRGNGTLSNFYAVGVQLLPHYPGVSSVSLAPEGIIREIVPQAGNEKAIDLDLLNNPATKKEASIARDTGKLTLTGPFKLANGKLAAIGRLPIFLDDFKGDRSFWGFINVEIGLREALEAAGLSELAAQGYAYELWRIEPESGTKQTIAASSSAALVEPVEDVLQVPNSTWTLSVMPVKGWGDPLGQSFKAALGLLFSALLAFVAKLVVDLRAHQEGLEKQVEQRTAELEIANRSLRKSEAHFRSLTELSSDWYWETDAEHRFTRGEWDAHAKLASVWRSPIGKRRWEIPYLSPDEAAWQAHRATLDGRLPFRDFEISRLGPDGTEHFLSLSGEPMFDPSGAFIGYRGVGTDITERRRAERSLRAAEELFRGLVEQSIAGIYIIQDGKFAYVNSRFAEIFGYDSAEEIVGRDFLSLVGEKDRDSVSEKIRQRIEGDVKSVSYEFTAPRKDGSMIDVGVHGTRATHRGKPAVIGLIQDISEKKRAEEALLRYAEELKTAFMSTVAVATTLSEMRDPYTAGHERRVGEIAVAIGRELGFGEHRLEGLRVAGYLHDIGKMSVPTEILTKPGRLTSIEFELIKLHSQASYNVLKDVNFPWPVARVALEHHERLDGSGYPQGLKGEAILLESRITAVADVIEAMASHRPYRPGLGIDKALAEIERGRGSAYDPVVADACLRLFREMHFQLPA